MIKCTLFVFLFCLSLFAHAGENRYSQQYYSCMGNSDGTTPAAYNCIVDEHSRQDARLNDVYKSLAAQLTGNRKKELLAAQRLWILYRDANCKVYAYPDGGGGETMAMIHASSCNLGMTTRRTNELESLLDA